MPISRLSLRIIYRCFLKTTTESAETTKGIPEVKEPRSKFEDFKMMTSGAWYQK